MENYKNLSGRSNVARFEIGEDFVTVEFKDLSKYTYTKTSAGSTNIDQMKKLAANGFGLNSYIMRHVKRLYAQKY
ncbi:MAG: hypothetical protein WC766_00935 [Patescibacteria group bacterium]|jgi:hypothetical protein